MIKIEIAYGDHKEQTLLALEIEAGKTVREVLEKNLPALQLENQTVGVFGEVVGLDYLLKENDRIEIYRPLLIDPKEERRKRGIKKRKHKHRNIRNYGE